jgi:DNA-binding transcriptional ArsR family regulator
VRDPVGPVFAALSDPSRRQLVETLARRETATLTELAAGLPLSRQAVSKHLAALADAGLVEATRRGRNTHYRLTPDRIGEALTWAERVGDEWDARLAALRAHLTTSPRERQ